MRAASTGMAYCRRAVARTQCLPHRHDSPVTARFDLPSLRSMSDTQRNVGRNSSRGRTRPCPPWERSAGSRS